MIRLRHALVRSLLTVVGMSLASCTGQSIAAPTLSEGTDVRGDQSQDAKNGGELNDAKVPREKDPKGALPFAVAYSGVLREGQFVVCTMKFWPAATYSISVNAAEPADRYVTTATVAGGACAVVFDRKKDKKNGIVPSITVTSDPSFKSNGAVVIDGTGAHDNFALSLAPQGYVLGGFAGGIAKFYYFPLGSPCGFHGTGLGIPTLLGICTGEHGGTSTLTFDVD